MEKKVNWKLPPIFKLPLLSRILPYFGYLHMWRRLLTQINKETEKIWEDNTEALVYIGRNFKKEKVLPSYINLSNIRRSFIDLYSLVISNSKLDSPLFMKHFLSLIKKLNKNEVIIWDIHKSCINKYSIWFCKEEDIHLILPAVLCSSFKIDWYEFDDDFSLFNLMIRLNKFQSKSIVIEKEFRSMFLYSVFSSILRIDNIYDWNIDTKELTGDMIERWQIKNWDCRPTKLQANIDNNVKNIKSILDQSCIETINDVQFDIKISSYSNTTIMGDIFESFPKARLNLDIKYNYNIWW